MTISALGAPSKTTATANQTVTGNSPALLF
jgi:hypothetical protein